VEKTASSDAPAERTLVSGPGADFAVGIALVLITVAVFGPVCTFDFVNYDDDVYVTSNLDVLQGIGPEGIEWAFTATRSNHWHPLTWLSLQRDVELFSDADGVHAGGFHLTNLLLHVGNVLLVFTALRRMTGQRGRSAVVAALFAVHPLHVESVAWVTERKDVLSTFFWLLTTLAYVGYARRPGWWRFGLVLVSFVLGLLAKSMLITLPFTLLLLDFWPLRRCAFGNRAAEGSTPSFAPAGIPRLILEKVPLFAVAGASAAVSFAARQMGGGIKSGEYFSLAERIGNAVSAPVVYLLKTFFPVHLAPFYPVPAGGWPVAGVAGEAALLVGLTALALRLRESRPYLTTGWLWYLGTLIPVCGLVQLGTYAYADRYTYVPTIGLYVALVWAAADILPGGTRVRWLVPAAVLAALALLSVRQVWTWHDSVALWEHARDVTADNFIVRTHLGLAYKRTGRLDEAESEIAAAVAMRPDLAEGYDDLGVINLRQGKLAEAESHFREAEEHDPGSWLYQQHLAEVLLKQGKQP
jgi:protein O-mannosyl-transferase